MPNYSFIKDAKGRSRIVQVADDLVVKKVEIVEPLDVTAEKTDEIKKYKCKVEGCGKKFAGPGMASMHYNRAHKTSDDKNEWRGFVEQVK